MKQSALGLLALTLSFSAAAQESAVSLNAEQVEHCRQMLQDAALIEATVNVCGGNEDIKDYAGHLYSLYMAADPQALQCVNYSMAMEKAGKPLPHYGYSPEQDSKQYCAQSRKERHLAQQRAEALVEKELPNIARKVSEESNALYQEHQKQLAQRQNAEPDNWEKPKSSKQILNEMREQLAASRKKAEIARRKIEKQ
ncbi:hypothetical protein ACMYUL_05925 [Neisseria sp. CP9]|uniref:hypothetical protein n=1 Tax=Neisseria sp. CP9 TaxID=3388843 RepID=UPI0039EDFAE1